MSEDQIQAAFFQKCWTELPETRRCLFAVPNGSTRDIREATKLKATGLIAGQPDMILIHQGKAYGFEFKTNSGVVSTNQRTVHQAWADQQTPVYVLRCHITAFAIVQAICSGHTLDQFNRYRSIQEVSCF
ncbi:VRR-NUC domain-containing protein [Pedobacter faecalis]|uniref:VRR-NUC domain-containing protein n=1 Tax=Pedobacter faecalis TaxID=3041495 RepID=UPI00254EDD65|nr:VRR-NUC domain-containing protein [Pedobacter sp. ELA7]